ncbi:MAG: protein-methionine-sulfoxide reductase heme-binding subunit MsrQ [Pseudomonadota bacterium]|nr:protein-methionine-sulfoxide reductase heme-binding subunit MsrQ [Pseudomonadota bacterium]HJO34809.1 protein-methionine-sulfoxide reductase heme-binding subunit MsrQ [Gammaproteobacteria bacterium]
MDDRLLRYGLKPVVFMLLLLPAALLLAGLLRGTLGADPVATLLWQTGLWALRLLLASLAVTPLQRLTGWRWPIRWRRQLGLFAFFYACLHLAVYAVFDRSLDLAAVWEDIVERPFITVGALAFLLLVPLAATSTRGAVRRLGPRWQQLHRLVYLAAGLAVLHYLWLVKADLRPPLIYAGILAVLLLLRLPLPLPWRRRLGPASG